MGAIIDNLNLKPTPQVSGSTQPKSTGYNPIQTFKSNIGKQASAVTGGLSWAGDMLSRPLYAFGSGLEGAYKGAEKEKTLSGWAKGGATGALKGLTGENKVTPGMYLTDTLLKDKIKNPLAKAGTQLATDLVADPLTGLAAKGISKGIQVARKGLNVASKVAPVEKAVQAAKGNKLISSTVEKFNPYWRNPEAGKVIEGTKEAIRGQINKLIYDIDEAQRGLSSAEKVRVGQLLEGGIATSKTDNRLVEIANKFKALAEDVGQRAVDTGLLNPKSFAEFKGKYMTHIWNDLTGTAQNITGDIPKISGQFFKQRKGAEGYVREFMAPVLKGLGTEIKDVEAANMYKRLASEFGVDAAKAGDLNELANKGYKFLENVPKSRGGEVLNNLLFPEAVADYITQSFSGGKRGELTKAFDYAMNLWKQGKTLWNPAYHVRNFLSNQILTDLQTGKGILPTVIDYAKVIIGNTDPQYVREAKQSGLIGAKYFGTAVDDFLNQSYKQKSFWQKLVSAPKDLQNWMESTAKLNVFTEMRKQGKTIKEALDLAEEAIFSPSRIPSAERSALGRIIPFYSFTRQAAPFIGKTALNHPKRITKYIKGERAVESLTEPKNEEYLPDYMNQMVRTPATNKKGQQYYFNPQYIYPWGNFVSESKGLPFGISLNPIMEELSALRSNRDMYFGSDIVKPGEPPVLNIPGIGDIYQSQIDHVIRTAAPSFYNALTTKIIPALQGKPDAQGRERNTLMTLLGEVGGLKFYPFDVEKGMQSKFAEKNRIISESKERIRSIQKRQDLSPEVKQKMVQEAIDYRDKRLNSL